jgi:hypothetical protein
MRRAALLLPVLVLGAGATALAQDPAPETAREPRVAAREVLRMPSSCRPGDRVTVRLRPPAGITLDSMRIHVAGLEVVRMTRVDAAASATVAVPRAATRVTATADTTGGQALYSSRIYNRCPVIREERPVVGGGED